MANNIPALLINDVSHAYGEKEALKNVSFSVDAGEFFTLLGPNGSGKSTLFRLVSTLAPVQRGSVQVMGIDVSIDQTTARKNLGVIFQNPAIDMQLTVRENLYCHGNLYGLDSATIKRRSEELMDRFGLLQNARDIVQTFSGGMRRRVELVKALLTEPLLLIMDEPSTGLDLHARTELWQIIRELRARKPLSVLLITHLMEEADDADQVAIIDRGQIVASGAPTELKNQLGGDVITFTGHFPEQLKALVEEHFKLSVTRIGNKLRIEHPQAHLLAPRIIEAIPGMIESISISRPSLDDVFVHHTGRSILAAAE